MTMDATEGVPIPEGELVFKASRSSGPGGQNVNKLNTRVTVLFDVAGSPSLSEEQKQRVRSRLAGRIGKDGILHVASQKHRSQEANRRAAVERLQQLVQEALSARAGPPEDKGAGCRTGAPAPGQKKQRSNRKQQRMGRNWGED